MAVTQRSLIYFLRIASALPLAPPLRFASPFPLCFRRYRHNSPHENIYHELPSFDEPDVPQRTQQQDKAPRGRRPALSVAEVKADLAETEWALSNNLREIERRYSFRNFEDAFKYMALVKQRCKAGGRHFPKTSNWGNRLFVRWSSYNGSYITRLDMQLSRFCDRLYNEKFAANVSRPECPSKQIPDDLDWADDRQLLYGRDTIYGANNHLDLWDWLPQLELYVQKENAYPLWGISYNRLVWTSLLWDSKTGTPKGMTPEDKAKWRIGAPIKRIQGSQHWLSNLADHASQIWTTGSWVEKPENPKQLPLRFSMARSNEALEKKKEQETKLLQDGNAQPKRPRPRTKNVRIYVD